ncbi:hypothetical protein DQX05_24260 [Paenibacillus thiaminolyticus]|uniref:Uncharacterized protein n=1 Tax=Paenibacillus thiaminolyticus TaxID=49283 RepID=A0A3A3GBR0_PANTH|nr:hypothetical protein DQX05_24260 [Paenibacillus thiaminolyticus]
MLCKGERKQLLELAYLEQACGESRLWPISPLVRKGQGGGVMVGRPIDQEGGGIECVMFILPIGQEGADVECVIVTLPVVQGMG